MAIHYKFLNNLATVLSTAFPIQSNPQVESYLECYKNLATKLIPETNFLDAFASGEFLIHH